MNLYQTYNCIEEMETMKENWLLYKMNINNLKDKPYNISIKYTKTILIAIDVFLILRLLFGIASKFFNIFTDTIYVMFILFIILISNILILKIVSLLISKILNKTFFKNDINKNLNIYYNEQSKVSNEYFKLKESLKDSVVPNKYHNIVAIKYIIGAIENKRANSLNEAINLYEISCENTKKDELIEKLILDNESLRNDLSIIKSGNNINKKLSKKAIKEAKRCLFRL